MGFFGEKERKSARRTAAIVVGNEATVTARPLMGRYRQPASTKNGVAEM